MDEPQIGYDSIDFEKVRRYMRVVVAFGELLKTIDEVDHPARD